MGNVTTNAPTSDRIASFDALRGFDMMWITGGDALIHSLHSVIHHPWMDALDQQFEHVQWQGFHFYDLIFPLFLFIVGLVLPWSITRRLEAGANRGTIYKHLVRRLVVLFCFGLVVNGFFNLDFHELRIPGVLQRIAICYFIAAIVMMNTGIKGQAAVAGGILVVYWLAMRFIPVPGGTVGDFSMTGNLASYIDRLVIPRPYCCFPYGDNEGLLSTLPAISTALLGAMAGHWLRTNRPKTRKALGLVIAGVASLGLGLLWSLFFPIVKNLWSSSFVLFAGGWSLLLLALFYWIIDILGYQRWAFYFKVIGLNSITIYVAHDVFDFFSVANVVVHGFIKSLGAWEPVFHAACVLAAGWLFLWFLYRQKIFLRV
jgi:predicted acyltransferase